VVSGPRVQVPVGVGTCRTRGHGRDTLLRNIALVEAILAHISCGAYLEANLTTWTVLATIVIGGGGHTPVVAIVPTTRCSWRGSTATTVRSAVTTAKAVVAPLLLFWEDP
jgi:hypothetical protein